MSRASIDQLIINSPYEEPAQHWRYDRKTRQFDRVDGRRPAGYVVASGDSKAFDDPGIVCDIPLVNQIRPHVQAWREAGYPDVSSITRRLLAHWTDEERFEGRRFFFCQLEAVETLIWLTETPADARAGVSIPSDGGAFGRLCTKMATGSGKTVVMAMIVAWQILNKVTWPRDARFSKHVLVVAPGLTVKNRLAVLEPSNAESYYEAFDVVPSALRDKLRQGKVMIRNWHALNWETEEKIASKLGVDKRGTKSDEAYAREALGDMARARNILVINDEAHHAWRVPAESKVRGVAKSDIAEATKWVGGLDRIHRARGVLTCYDFSATPFAPSGKRSSEEALFDWIVSDFGLSDAIESGLVKTPRIVIRDDAVLNTETYKSRFYHIYNDDEVKPDLNGRAKPEQALPPLVVNAYFLLAQDWLETAKDWTARRGGLPPVMITVANRTETAARIKHAFDHGKIGVSELCDSERTLHIDSKALKIAEAAAQPIAGIGAGGNEADAPGSRARGPTKKEQAELLRRQVDTVGQPGKAGERIQNVISVGMLSEGWDAKTVTHIMGLRAFTSQLLCEQVVGRGLRRASYDVNPETGLLEAEYVNIFGVPFTFLPHEDAEDGPPAPPQPTTAIGPVAEQAAFAISWPNVSRIDHSYPPRLTLDWRKLQPLELDAQQTAGLAVLAPTIEGKPDETKTKTIRPEGQAEGRRMQRIVFETALEVYDRLQPDWPGGRELLLAQLVALVEKFIRADNGIRVTPAECHRDSVKRRLTIMLNMPKLVQHIWHAIQFESPEKLEPIFDRDCPIRSTADMGTWHTRKPCERTQRSHINFCVYDSTWEASDAFELDRAPEVAAWAKNDHLGFEVSYVHGGVARKYRPDFLVRLGSGTMLVLETKGLEREQDEIKRRFLDEWVRAINAHGGFGRWSHAVSKSPGDIKDILKRHSSASAA